MNWIKPKIFIVDDDSIYLAIMNQQFKNHGIDNVTIYESAVDGIKSNFGKPDLVFVDFHMNDINGARASKMFSKKWKNARIVLISNSDSIKKIVKSSKYYQAINIFQNYLQNSFACNVCLWNLHAIFPLIRIQLI